MRGSIIIEINNKLTNSNKYSVPSVKNAFDILTLLSRKTFQESTLTEIASALSLSPPTCYRILQQLRELSVVRYDVTKKRYTLGTYLMVLGDRAKERIDYIQICLPYLSELSRQTGLTAVLVNKVDEKRLTHIAKVEGESYGIRVPVGGHYNIMNGGAYGKCFLAFMNKTIRNEYLQNSNLNETESQILREELEEFNSTGFCVSYGDDYNELFPGIFGVAAPIFLEENKLEICISVIGMTAQISKENILSSLGPAVKDTANKITNEFIN